MGNSPSLPRLSQRQADILSLAAAGFSDKEIAARLKVAHRTVRTHFEKIFRDHGLHNRSQAIALWYGRTPASRPADECPYPKPFPPGFSDCPAYQATQMVTLDISHRPLGSVLTCRHLISRLVPNTDYRWYGACIIGDEETRRRWSSSVGTERLHDISRVREEVSALTAPYVQRIQELRTRPVIGGAAGAAARVQEMQDVVEELMGELRRLLQQRREVLDQLHLPLEACVRLVRMAIDRFVKQGTAEAEWEVPDEVLALFPAEVRPYFRPRQATDSPSTTAPRPAASGSGRLNQFD
jgi:DNA-binding CsgD family transcriptional regulator